ncbi:DUF4951 domain-containing protein [uncultured Bradyrhizobium sp.]|jgi:hypothetical protein|uniref:DUF4951 domain-containing protein n=1 Tax=uncultured Bradyrhizobium sp. TaxID=199684 RepID=UPI002608CF51|nr:DUF4951 domain-containing protein [uncultured Bradyrhizobium sp.]
MADYSLVPVEHQPDFENASLVPVDHNPFPEDEPQQAQSPQAQSEPALAQSGQRVQPQLTQAQPQSQPQPVLSAQPKSAVSGDSAVGGGSGSPFVKFFNQLAAPELAQSEGVTDLVRNNPTAAKIEGAFGVGSLLLPPLAIAGAEALGLFGVGGSAVADGLAGSTVSAAGRAAAGSAARQAIAEAEATLPEGIKRAQFGRLAGFEQGLEASRAASTEATAEIISRLKSAGITARSIAAFQKIYEGVARDNPSNLSAVHRAALLAKILRNFQ